MMRVGLVGRLLCALGVVLFAVAFVAGAIQSLRVERRLPVIDLIIDGPEDHIDELVTRKDYAGAISQLQMQTRLQPSNAAAHEHLGNLLGTQSRLLEARVQFQQLVRLKPDYAEGYNYLGSTYLNTGQPALAARSFEQAIRLKPAFPVAHNNLGVTRAQQGDLEQAEKCFAKAVELAPDYNNARINLDNARKELRRIKSGFETP